MDEDALPAVTRCDGEDRRLAAGSVVDEWRRWVLLRLGEVDEGVPIS
jgi:hypothetical protein